MAGNPPRFIDVSALRTVRLGRCDFSSVSHNELESSLELDSHADTSCLGGGALIILDHEQPVTVQGYDPALGQKTYQTVSGVIGFDHPQSGARHFLVIHQAVHIPNLDHHLLCPMQVRMNGHAINECPRFMTAAPDSETHAIIAEDQTCDSIIMPLHLRGVTSYLAVSRVTADEWERGDCPVIHLTSPTLRWDPNDLTFAEQEAATMDVHSHAVERSADKSPASFIN